MLTRSVFFLAAMAFALLTNRSVNAETYEPRWALHSPKRVIPWQNEVSTTDLIANGRRLRELVETLLPGDQLVIPTGTFMMDRYWDITVSGTSEDPIVITAAPEAKVVITRTDQTQNVMNVGAKESVRFLVLKRLEVTGGSHGIRLGKCGDIWIDQCHIHHTAGVCLSANQADTQRLFVTRNTIHDGGGTAEGMYLGGNHGEVIMSESVIALNHVSNCHGSQGDGIEIKQGSWGNLVAENHVHDCNYPCITVYGTNGRPQNIIERNLCYTSADSVMQIQGEAIVRNNVLINGKNAAFASTDHQGKTLNLQVVHNTMVNGNHAFRGGSWNRRENMVLANNVLYSRDQNAMHFANGFGGVTIAGNVVFGNGEKHGSKLGRGLNDFQDLSWNAMTNDARPSIDAAFNQGSAAYQVLIDFTGKSRRPEFVISGAFDLALETTGRP